MSTAAWNALTYGRKRWVMFHPSTPAELLRTGNEDGDGEDDDSGGGGGGAANAVGGAYGGGDGCQAAAAWEDLWGWFEDVRRASAARIPWGNSRQRPAANDNAPPQRER